MEQEGEILAKANASCYGIVGWGKWSVRLSRAPHHGLKA